VLQRARFVLRENHYLPCPFSKALEQSPSTPLSDSLPLTEYRSREGISLAQGYLAPDWPELVKSRDPRKSRPLFAQRTRSVFGYRL
jgi:hypothetical protein